MYWDIARHPGDVTENGIAAFDDVVNHIMQVMIKEKLQVVDMSLTRSNSCLTFTVL